MDRTKLWGAHGSQRLWEQPGQLKMQMEVNFQINGQFVGVSAEETMAYLNIFVGLASPIKLTIR